MAKQYDHKQIESKWQKRWEDSQAFKTPDSPTKKLYVLDMFPYPSGAGLHVGHVGGYTGTDIYSRFKRMQGYDVLHPMGWDSFGLPAENYAVKTGIPPAKTTNDAVTTFRAQIKRLGLSYDWSREVGTHTPEYYKWTQWLFLKFYNEGLVYKKKALVNWDPVDQTVLANEQVLPDGTAERSGAKVVQKELEQWFFKITDYADALVDDLDTVDWPESTKINQRNWIGRSEGAEIDFAVSAHYKFVLLHGFKSSPKDDTYVWIKKTLEKMGHQVLLPALPNPANPTEEEWVKASLNATQYDENTVIMGHSLGGVTALKVAEKLPTKIAGVLTFGAFAEPNFVDHPRPFGSTFHWQFDGEKIRKNTNWVKLLHDTTDNIVSHKQAGHLSKLVGVSLTLVKANEPHFNAPEEPEVVKAVVPSIRVFTTRPDTLFGATYMVLAPEHPLAETLATRAENKDEILRYIVVAKDKTDLERQEGQKDKTGVELKGVKAINPANKEEIPIFVADYVLGSYGTGAIMGVPAHDERDMEFAKKFNLPVKEIELEDPKEITKKVGGVWVKQYRLRDWLISRQRYWGAPIPIVYDTAGKAHAIPEEHLPWMLPTDVEFKPTGTSPLGQSKELLERTEKIFGKGWKPEVDTLDTFMCSSWYFFRFADPHNGREFASREAMQKWLPVDLYVGGAEHTVLHLMYARFITHALKKFGYITFNEPFTKLRHQGTILAENGNKMSKSKGNVINPDEVVERYGADTLRLYEMFMGPFEAMKPWSTQNILGVRRFLERVWKMSDKLRESLASGEINKSPTPAARDITPLLHQTIKKVGDDIESLKFNTAVSALMILQNQLETLPTVPKDAYKTFLTILAPFAPHIASELWEQLGEGDLIYQVTWPIADESKLVQEIVKVAVQINGKLRATLELPAGMGEAEALSAARADTNVAKWLALGKEARAVYVPSKVINFVVQQV